MARSTVALILAYLISVALSQEPAIATTGLRPIVYQGCFSSSKPMAGQGSDTYQSSGHCQGLCVKLKKAVMGMTTGSDCYCGDLLPTLDDKAPDSKCDTPCFGFDKEMCGGTNFWTVYLTGTNLNVAHIGDSSDSSPSGSGSKPSEKASADASPTPKPKEASVPPSPSQTKDTPATIITKGTTIVVTAPGQTNAKATAPVTTEKASQGPNKAGIAAGTVVGVAALCAIAGGLFFFLRNRRRRAAQEDNHSRSNENPFNTNNLPSSAASMSDSRLEPSVMMQRRQSDGSIADNQDYSRRILKVTNPDGRL